MSQCIGAGCTEPGCSGKNAEAIRAVSAQTHRRIVIQAGGRLDLVPNRKDRRSKARRGKRRGA